jgi:hypothetical protein
MNFKIPGFFGLILLLLFFSASTSCNNNVKKGITTDDKDILTGPSHKILEQLNNGIEVRTRLLISQSQYSKENIETLFRLFSRRYPYQGERVFQVIIYLDMPPNRPYEKDSIYTQWNWPDEDKYNEVAFYERTSKDESGKNMNEWYYYAPDPRKTSPGNHILVRLSGDKAGSEQNK